MYFPTVWVANNKSFSINPSQSNCPNFTPDRKMKKETLFRIFVVYKEKKEEKTNPQKKIRQKLSINYKMFWAFCCFVSRIIQFKGKSATGYDKGRQLRQLLYTSVCWCWCCLFFVLSYIFLLDNFCMFLLTESFVALHFSILYMLPLPLLPAKVHILDALVRQKGENAIYKSIWKE